MSKWISFMEAPTIDCTLGLRRTQYGYQYSKILRSLMCVYLCGGSCVENVMTHLMRHQFLHPFIRTCSTDTILRDFKELAYRSWHIWVSFRQILRFQYCAQNERPTGQRPETGGQVPVSLVFRFPSWSHWGIRYIHL